MKVPGLLMCWVLLGGCSNMLATDGHVGKQIMPSALNQPLTAENTIHHHVEQLAKQLFSTAQHIDLYKSVVVGTFLPVSSIGSGTGGNKSPQFNLIGHQIQESFVTLATQIGLNIVEFKTMSAIKISNNADMMLSRQLSDLNRGVSAGYYLTGTYAQQENSLVVNVRLIDVSSQQVIAAATDYIPANSMWQQAKLRMRGNMLYRVAN